ncbi:glutaminyl-peptide cyclotransferase [Rurimicrobium arvi]
MTFLKSSRNIASIVLLSLSAAITGCGEDKPAAEKAPVAETTPASKPVQIIPHQVVATYTHDTSLFTEGFLFHEGKLYESTGSPEEDPELRSVIGTIALPSGVFTRKVEIDKTKYFGEGISFLNGKMYQLTYKNKMGFIYDAKTFAQTGTFNYDNAEGWGLTTDGTQLIMSDGTDALTFIDPATMKPSRQIKVMEAGVPLPYLNELEYINGYIYANVWMTNYIVKINPKDGQVEGRLDLNPVAYDARSKSQRAEVMNGIAFDPASQKVYVTGKMWPKIYEIKFAF